MVVQGRYWRILYVACATAVVLAVAFLTVLPAFDAVIMSARRGAPLQAYRNTLHDPAFAPAVLTTIIYVIVTVPVQLLFGFLCAVHVYLARRPLVWFTIYFLPYAVPVYAGVGAWRWMLDRRGYLATALSHFGVAPETWLGTRALATLCLVSVWCFAAFVFASILARLYRIPAALHATAATDGLSVGEWLRVVVWPQIKNTVVIVTVLRIAFMASKFDVPWLLVGSTSTASGRTFTIFIAERIGGDARGSVGVAAAVLLAGGLAVLFGLASAILGRRALKEVRNAT